jgi:hypothetical protein
VSICQKCHVEKTYHTCADCGARLCGKCTERVQVYDEAIDMFVMARLCKDECVLPVQNEE